MRRPAHADEKSGLRREIPIVVSKGTRRSRTARAARHMASSVSGACDGAGGCDAEAAQANAVACSGGSAEVRPVVSPTAASSSILQPRSASRKRALEEDPTPTRRSDPPRRVSFSHVRVREHAIDVGGGGGVPSDDGPPLGLGWDIKGEHTQ